MVLMCYIISFVHNGTKIIACCLIQLKREFLRELLAIIWYTYEFGQEFGGKTDGLRTGRINKNQIE